MTGHVNQSNADGSAEHEPFRIGSELRDVTLDRDVVPGRGYRIGVPSPHRRRAGSSGFPAR